MIAAVAAGASRARNAAIRIVSTLESRSVVIWLTRFSVRGVSRSGRAKSFCPTMRLPPGVIGRVIWRPPMVIASITRLAWTRERGVRLWRLSPAGAKFRCRRSLTWMFTPAWTPRL